MGHISLRAADVRGIGGAASGPFRGRGIEVDLHVGRREHHRANVAAVHHHAAVTADHALPIHQHVAHRRNARDNGRGLVDVRRADVGGDVVAVDADAALVHLDGRLGGDARGLVVRVEPQVPPHRFPGHRAVHRAGVHVPIAEGASGRPRHGAFPRTGRAVDGNHEALHNRAV